MNFTSTLRSIFRPQQVIQYNVQPANVNVLDMDSAALYETQPNLQAVVTFLADNIAQLPLKTYERKSDTDRKRDTATVAARLLKNPNGYMTTYELIRATALDYYIYGRCIWLITEDDETQSGWSIVPIPPTWVQKYNAANSFQISSIEVVTSGTQALEIPASKLLIFKTYHPTSPSGSVSPINAIKQTLTEQIEADRFRLAVWKNGGKASAYIVRPKDVQPWTEEAAKKFKKDFRDAYTGKGSGVGGVPVLEDGMELKTLQMNARESQWAEAKKMSREDVASIYHVNPALIWHTDGQTYASAKDNARALYNDTLAPILQMFEQRINAFLLPMIGEREDVYCEFDLREKLRGSFEEQASVIQTSVGAPWLTRNEARAMNNMPAIEGGDELVVPLNVLTGGQASPTDSGSQNATSREVEVKSNANPIKLKSTPQNGAGEEIADVLVEFFKRQERSVLPKIGASKESGDYFNIDRWNSELADDLYKPTQKQVTEAGKEYAKQLGGDFDGERTEAYTRKMCENRASAINTEVRRRLQATEDADEDSENESATPAGVFEEMRNRADGYGLALAATAAAFSMREAVTQTGTNTSQIMKTWITTSGNPRASHAAMNGETVPYSEPFSNGAMFPHDADLDAEESCYCQCEVEILIP